MQTGPHKVAEGKASKKKGNQVTISPKGFDVTWGNDDRYWSFIDDGSEKSCAMLKQVSWLEVTCSTDEVTVGNTYKVGFKVSLRPDAFGWNEVEVYVMAKVGKSGKFKSKKVSLGKRKADEVINIPDDPLEITATAAPTKSDHQNEQKHISRPSEIYFGLYEVWSKKWKGGLKIHEAFIEEVSCPHPKNGDSSKSRGK